MQSFNGVACRFFAFVILVKISYLCTHYYVKIFLATKYEKIS